MRFCSMQTSMLNTSSLYKRHSNLDTCYYDLRHLHLGGYPMVLAAVALRRLREAWDEVPSSFFVKILEIIMHTGTSVELASQHRTCRETPARQLAPSMTMRLTGHQNTLSS